MKKQNITKMELMVSTPDGGGVLVKPWEYVEGEYFKDLPSYQWKELTDMQAANFRLVYSCSVLDESSNIFIYADSEKVMSPTLFNSSKLNLSAGQIYGMEENAVYEGIVPDPIFIVYPFPNDAIIKFNVSDNTAVIPDSGYNSSFEGPGYRYYLKNAYLTYKNPETQSGMDDFYPELDLNTLKLLSTGPGEEVERNLITNGTFDTDLSGWYGVEGEGLPPNGWIWTEEGAFNPEGGGLSSLQQNNRFEGEDDLVGLEATVTVKAIIPPDDPGFTVNVYDGVFNLLGTLNQSNLEITNTTTIQSGGVLGGASLQIIISPQDSNLPLTITEVSAIVTYSPNVTRDITKNTVIGKGLVSLEETPGESPTYYIDLNQELDIEGDYEYSVECAPAPDELMVVGYSQTGIYRFKDTAERVCPED